MLELKSVVKQIMLQKGFLVECDCGYVFGRNHNCSEGMIYGAMTKELSDKCCDRNAYCDAIKELLDEGSLVNSCDKCGWKNK